VVLLSLPLVLVQVQEHQEQLLQQAKLPPSRPPSFFPFLETEEERGKN